MWEKKELQFKRVNESLTNEDETAHEPQIGGNKRQQDNWNTADPLTGDFVSVCLVDNHGKKKELVAQILEMDDGNLHLHNCCL